MVEYSVVLDVVGTVRAVPVGEVGDRPVLIGPLPGWSVASTGFAAPLKDILWQLRGEAKQWQEAAESGRGMVRLSGFRMWKLRLELPLDTAVTCHWATQCPRCEAIWVHTKSGGTYFHASSPESSAVYRVSLVRGEGCLYCQEETR